MTSTIVEQAEAAERQEAARLLLRSPLVLSESDKEAFAGIRRQHEFLRQWFQQWFGYRLVVERDFARLHKVALPVADCSRPAVRRSGIPFDRQRYVLLCLLLAALDRGEQQAVLSDLAEAVRELAQVELLPVPDFDRHAERRAFVDAVRLLVGHGVLRPVDGDEGSYLEGGGDVLYDVDLRIAAHLLSTGRNPRSRPDDPAGDVTVYADNQDGANLRTRHRLMRRLAEQPVVYFADLDEQEFAYVTSQRPAFRRELHSVLGLRMEIREEGIVTLDPDNELSDLDFPAHNTVAHAALLLAGRLALEAGEEGTDRRRVFPHTWVIGQVEELANENQRYWSGQYCGDAEKVRRLADGSIRLLVDFGLVLPAGDGIQVLPAINRYWATNRREEQTSWTS